jgi:hypothetical protein
MRLSRYLLLPLVLITCFQYFPVLSPVSGACNPPPVIVNQLPRMSSGWSGAVAWYNGKIYEVADATSYANIKNPVTGALEGQIYFGSWAANDTKGFTYDRFRGTFWCKVGNYAYQVAVTGGDYISRIPVQNNGMAFGIWCDPDEENVMWIADPVNPQVRKIDMLNSQVLKVVPAPFPVRGVARTGNTLWCVRAGEPGQKGVVAQVNLDGNEICRFNLPPGRYEHDAGGCEIDPGGFLWVHGGKGTAIYQYDIGYIPTTPTPVPTPSPVPYSIPILDSGDYDGDGITDLAVFRPATGLWTVRGVTRFFFGEQGDIPAGGDYSGDGTTDVAVFRPRRSLWAIRGVTRAVFGAGDDVPVPGDYNGDGSCDIGVFRARTGLWAVRGVTRVYFGTRRDRPVPGYYTGSRAKDIAVFRPATGLWMIRGLTRTYFGSWGDLPVPGDYSGAGMDQIAIYRPGSRLWAVRGVTRLHFGPAGGSYPQPGDYRGEGLNLPAVYNPVTGFWAVRGSTRLYFGQRGDLPVSGPPSRTGFWRMPVIDSGDYRGLGYSQIALFRDADGLWAIRGPYKNFQIYYGQKGDLPVSGDYDGDGISDIAVYRPSSGLWSARFVTRFYFGGEAGDLPVPGDYNGNGTCDSAIFNPRSGLWQVRIEIPFGSRSASRDLFGEEVEPAAAGADASGPERKTGSTAPFVYQFAFGGKGDIPVPGYYSGRPRKSIATYNPSAGLWSIRGMTRFYFGRPGDFPVPVDLAGEGTDRAGIYRPATRLWAVRGLTRIYFGSHSDCLPAAADYRGDGFAELGVFRPKTGHWEIRDLTRLYYGRAGDTPAVGGVGGAAAR